MKQLPSLLRRYSSMIALPHAVFALPFALASLLLAEQANTAFPNRYHGAQFSFLPTVILIVLAIVLARTAAMTFNRIIDAHIDALNPRTKSREIPSGQVSIRSAIMLTICCSMGFLIVSGLLGAHCLKLAPLVLLTLFAYSYTKRFTACSHLFLGLALALAPGAAWWVVRPSIEPTPLLIMFGVAFWVAGFDILYSCQDESFDVAHGLHSIPALLGTHKALLSARVCHLVSAICFLLVGWTADLGPMYYLGMIAIGILFVIQHSLISAEDLSRINKAFFTVNGIISLFYLLIVAGSIFVT